jgi:hypothetical protein
MLSYGNVPLMDKLSGNKCDCVNKNFPKPDPLANQSSKQKLDLTDKEYYIVFQGFGLTHFERIMMIILLQFKLLFKLSNNFCYNIVISSSLKLNDHCRVKLVQNFETHGIIIFFVVLPSNRKTKTNTLF